MDYIIYFALTIGILVFVHEFGHFAAAKNTLIPMYVLLGTAVLNCVLNFILIPSWGVMGAVWATLISYIFHFLLTTYLIRRHFQMSYDFLFFGRILAVTIPAVYIGEQFIDKSFSDSIWLNFGLGALVFILYTCALAACRCVRREDLRLLAEMLKLRNRESSSEEP